MDFYSVGIVIALGLIGVTCLSFLYAYVSVYSPISGYLSPLYMIAFAMGVGWSVNKIGHSFQTPLFMQITGLLIGIWALYTSWVVFIYAYSRMRFPQHPKITIIELFCSPGSVRSGLKFLSKSGWYSINGQTPKGTLLWAFWGIEAGLILGCGWVLADGEYAPLQKWAPLAAFAGIGGMMAGFNLHLNALQTSPLYTFEVIKKIPHDPKAFTQGLLFHEGFFYESTGRRGHSTVRRVHSETGTVEQLVQLDQAYFGEGLAYSEGKLVQLTLDAKKAFVYDKKTLKLIGEHAYETKGWGLTHDGECYIMSDGSHNLSFLDGAFKTQRILEVREGKHQLKNLNDLEYIEGEIWANVYETKDIVRIDPASGQVKGRVRLEGIGDSDRTGNEAHLNGIAYDPVQRAIYVTGKYYSYIYQIMVFN